MHDRIDFSQVPIFFGDSLTDLEINHRNTEINRSDTEILSLCRKFYLYLCLCVSEVKNQATAFFTRSAASLSRIAD